MSLRKELAEGIGERVLTRLEESGFNVDEHGREHSITDLLAASDEIAYMARSFKFAEVRKRKPH